MNVERVFGLWCELSAEEKQELECMIRAVRLYQQANRGPGRPAGSKTKRTNGVVTPSEERELG